MPQPAPKLRLLLAHNADIYPHDNIGFDRQTLRPVPDAPVPRAATTHTPAGTIVDSGLEVPFYHVELGDPEDLPDPEEGVFLVVSALTIQAVLRQNQRPTDDLLCLYDEVWEYDETRKESRLLGTRGLSQPVIRPHTPQPVELPKGRIEAVVHNACPYPAALYTSNAPDEVGATELPLKRMPPARDYLAASHYEHLLEDLSDSLGVPVYRTIPSGIRNYDAARATAGELSICSPNVPLCAGALAVQAGLIVQTLTVRSIEPRDRGVVVGCRAYGMLGPSVLASYQI
jgi:hypothetical protein